MSSASRAIFASHSLLTRDSQKALSSALRNLFLLLLVDLSLISNTSSRPIQCQGREGAVTTTHHSVPLNPTQTYCTDLPLPHKSNHIILCQDQRISRINNCTRPPASLFFYCSQVSLPPAYQDLASTTTTKLLPSRISCPALDLIINPSKSCHRFRKASLSFGVLNIGHRK